MENTQPSDFLPLKKWYLEYGKPVFTSEKILHYHTKPVQKDLIEAGAMARAGVKIFIHKTRFWPEYQRIMADRTDGASIILGACAGALKEVNEETGEVDK